MTRQFRTQESFEFEKLVRDWVPVLLESRGFLVRENQLEKWGSATSQAVFVEDQGGEKFGFRVRLCWRRGGRNEREFLYSAAQLRARLIEDDWEKTVKSVAMRGIEDGVTHQLFVQGEPDRIVAALALHSKDLLEVWRLQRSTSDDLIRTGQLGRITKNHAENGSSPTIWLQDDRTPLAHKVADIIWRWPTALNVMAMPLVEQTLPSVIRSSADDTFDDLNQIGSDGGERLVSVKSGWARDPKVRELVRQRSGGVCEKPGCSEMRSFSSFLDVHHILGVWASDRPWTCVALCPNCHREAHFSPHRDAINNELLAYAQQFES